MRPRLPHMDALWGIGVVDAPIARFCDPSFVPVVRWLRNAPFHQYFADPCAALGPDGGVTVLCEAYDYAKRRGHIVRFDLDDPFAVSVVESSGTHRSFPTMNQIGGRTYFVRETLPERQVRAASWDGERVLDEHVLVRDVDACDPVLFEREGRVWLFFTDREHRLRAFFSDAIDQAFSPHALDPLPVSPLRARAAGLPFVVDGRLYRPVQDRTRRYGGALAIVEVTQLDPRAYAERLVRRLDPVDDTYPLGLHTLASAGPRTLVDGLRPSSIPPFVRALVGWTRAARRSA